MRLFIKTAILASLIALLSGAGNLGYTSQPNYPISIKVTLEPELPMVKGSPITLNLIYVIDSICSGRAANTDSYLVTFINPRDYGDTLSLTTYQADHGDGLSRGATIQVNFPDADTCWLHLKLTSGGCFMRYDYFFVASGDKYEYRPDYYMPVPIEYQSKTPSEDYSRDELMRDTLTQEHLQTEYEVIIDLRDSSHLEFATKILRSIPDSCLYDKRRGYYRIKTTLENLIKFGDHNFEFEFTTPPPWDRRYKAPSESRP
jgi:hypothetical protein